MKGDVINETGELSMLPHYFMGMNKKLFLGPVGAAAAAAVAAEWSLSVVGWWCFILCSDACVRRLVAWVFAVAHCGAPPRFAAAPHSAEAFCLGNANAAVAASFREKAVAVYGPDKQPWRLS